LPKSYITNPLSRTQYIIHTHKVKYEPTRKNFDSAVYVKVFKKIIH